MPVPNIPMPRVEAKDKASAVQTMSASADAIIQLTGLAKVTVGFFLPAFP